MFDCLEQLYMATNGAVDVYANRKIQNIGRYVYRVHIDDQYFVNFADCPAILHIPAALVYRYGQRIGDQALINMGLTAFHTNGGKNQLFRLSLLRRLPAIFHYEQMNDARESGFPYLKRSWMSDIEVWSAREHEGSRAGLFVAAKGGHNQESHNHNDTGQVIIYSDGHPAIIDVGVETYTAKTFSPKRYDIWTMQSSYHNLPSVGGHMQAPGPDFKARNIRQQADDAVDSFQLDIAGAYPEEAGVKLWQRTVRLVRTSSVVEVIDDYSLRHSHEVRHHWMTAAQPQQTEEGIIHVPVGHGQTLQMEMDPSFDVHIERISISDARLSPCWGDAVYRIVLKSVQPTDHGSTKWRFYRI